MTPAHLFKSAYTPQLRVKGVMDTSAAIVYSSRFQLQKPSSRTGPPHMIWDPLPQGITYHKTQRLFQSDMKENEARLQVH